MLYTNDEKIISLKKEIDKKRKELKKINNFQPITNCIFKDFNMNFNIHTMNLLELRFLAIKIKQDIDTAKKLKFNLEDLKISSFKLEDWLSDILNKIDSLTKKEKLNSLNKLEEKLKNLLSEEKRTELELKEIETFLKS